MKKYDLILFNGEEILDLRLNLMFNYVDYFVIVEFDENFQKKKNLTILELIHLINLKKKLFTKGTKCQQCLVTKAPGIENVTKETLL